MLCRSKLSQWVLENFQKVLVGLHFASSYFTHYSILLVKDLRRYLFLTIVVKFIAHFRILWLNAMAEKSQV